MMGSILDVSSLMLGDNKNVVLNTTIPSSVLIKKYCAVSYHKICEMITFKVLSFVSIDSEDNYTDLLIKLLSPIRFMNSFKTLLLRDPLTNVYD